MLPTKPEKFYSNITKQSYYSKEAKEAEEKAKEEAKDKKEAVKQAEEAE